MSTETRWGSGVNAEAIAAWDGPLYDRFARFRDIIVGGLAGHGDAALAAFPPQPGWRVLDAAARFIETATAETAELGVPNARFAVADVQIMSEGLAEFQSEDGLRAPASTWIVSAVAP